MKKKRIKCPACGSTKIVKTLEDNAFGLVEITYCQSCKFLNKKPIPQPL